MSKGDFAAGRPVPLMIPTCVRREWQINGGEGRAEVEAEFSHSMGYEFEWGQIIEELLDHDRPEKTDDPPPLCARWHFVLADLHNEFLDAGGYLGDLADLALYILEEIREYALTEVAPENRGDIVPDYIEFDEGNNISAFEIAVFGVDNIDPARQWVDSFFLPGVLPRLISQLQAENREAELSPNFH